MTETPSSGFENLLALINSIRADFHGERLAQAALKVSLVFDAPHSFETRQKVLSVIPLYQSWVPPGALTWWVSEGGRPKDLTKHPVPMDKLLAEARNPVLGMAFAMGSGEGPVAKRFDNAQPYTLTFVCSSNDMPGAAYLNFYVPLEHAASQRDDRSFRRLINGLVQQLQPLHATAGLGLVFPEEGGHFHRNIGESFLIYPIAKRHPGLEIAPGLSYKSFLTSIYTVNWLNYVREDLMGPLGGKASLLKACAQAGLPTEELGRCVLIQAGPAPLPGDTVLGLDLPEYRAAMKILRPIRVAHYDNIFIAPPPDGIDDPDMTDRASLAYLTRFDDEPVPYPV
jgi:hypothetical protein